MADLDHNVAGELLKLSQERAAKRDELQNTLAAQTAPVIENTSPPPSQVAPVETPKPEAVLPVEGSPEVPKEEAKAADPLTAPVVEEPLKSWDEDVTEVVPPVESKFDAKKLGSAFGLEVKDETELITSVTEKLAKIKQLESERETLFEGVPESLKEAIEVAKKGGDWQSLTGNHVDVAKIDPVELFEREFERQESYKYKNPDTGTIDYSQLDAALDAIPDALKTFQGNAMKQQIAQMQNQQKMAIMQDAERKQMDFNKKLSEATSNLSKSLPKEAFGITFEPKHSEYLYNGISNQSLVRKHLGDIPPEILSRLDPAKLTKAIALAEYGDKISKFQFNQGQVAAKRELLQKTQNPVLNTGGVPAAPEVTDTERPKSSVEKLKDFRDRHIQSGSL